MGLAVVIKVKTTTHSTAAVLGLHATAPYGLQQGPGQYTMALHPTLETLPQ